MLDVLLVDDDADTAYLLCEFLRRRGHTVRHAENGVVALQCFDKRFPQVVISDVEMPTLDGPAMVYRMFVEDLGRESIPLILLSGRSDLAEIARAVGTPYYLDKPFDVGVLLALVEHAAVDAVPPRPTLILARGVSDGRGGFG